MHILLLRCLNQDQSDLQQRSGCIIRRWFSASTTCLTHAVTFDLIGTPDVSFVDLLLDPLYRSNSHTFLARTHNVVCPP